MISNEHQFIFFHINKTGGTSIEKVFEHQADEQDVAHKHEPVAFYQRRFPKQFRDYFKFAFVRNPWDWLVSRYHWTQARQGLIDYSFRELLHRLKGRIRLSPTAPWLEEALSPQLSRLTIGSRIAVDFVGRYECLQGDFDRVCARLNIKPVTLPHVFKTDHTFYADYYDEECRRLVEELYADDIAAFGYRFGDGSATGSGQDSHVVRSFWHGADLSIYEELSLSSFVKQGHAVQLFTYRDVRAIEGVQRVDAASILPESEVFHYRSGPGKGSVAAFSNLFRYKLLHELGGTWIDTDVLCLKHLSTLPATCVAWQDAREINNAVMRFPPKHALTGELYERALALGRDVSWGQAGPRLLTEVVLRSREPIAILPSLTFYPIPYHQAWRLIDPNGAAEIEALAARSHDRSGWWRELRRRYRMLGKQFPVSASGCYCVHWWNEVLRRLGVGKGKLPPADSYLYRRAREILGTGDLDVWPASEYETWISNLSTRGKRSRRHGSRVAGPASAEPSGLRIERLSDAPIVRPEMLPGADGQNINGPSLIRVPAWIEKPLGKYYLYFAHHHGKYIRLAFADSLAGPWTVHQPGTLRLDQIGVDRSNAVHWREDMHIASPDVLVDEPSHTIRMYFHGLAPVAPEQVDSYPQHSMLATSHDGLHFVARPEPLGNPYFRVFRWRGDYYALSMPGVFYRSADGLTGFVQGPTLFTADMRHAAVKVDANTLQVFFTVVGDNPERILLSTIDLTPPWMDWQGSVPQVVLEPQTDWEGANLPATPSVRGPARGRVRQLRDPAILEEDNQTYLLYAVAGESGIAISKVHAANRDRPT